MHYSYNEYENKIIKNFEKISLSQIKKIFLSYLEEKKRLDVINNSLPLAIIIIDAKMKIRYLNKYGERFFKKSKSYHSKKLPDCLLSVKLAKVLLPEIKLAIKEGKNFFKEFNFSDYMTRDLGIWGFHSKDTNFQSHIQSHNKGANKEVNAKNYSSELGIYIADLTNWKNKTLEENQKESINSLNTLTAGIAHEIKNPLSSLDLHLQLISRFVKKTPISNKEELEENLSIIKNEISRLDSIINDFLYSFRPQTSIKKKEHLNKIIEECLNLLAVEIKEKKINLEKNLSAQNDFLPFDKDQIKQMLINLIKNSQSAILEYRGNYEGFIKVSTEDRKESLLLIVEDNGIGISKKNLIQIFKPFYTTKKMGTGLGLSIISRIAKSHGGEVIINSNYKKGTEIIVEFSKNLLSLEYHQMEKNRVEK